MGQVDKLYDWLAGDPAPDCDRILAGALARAEQPYFERITALLLERENDVGWAGLISHFTRLTPEEHDRLGANDELMRKGIARALKAGSREARRNALAAFEAYPVPRLSYLLAEMLREGPSANREWVVQTIRNSTTAFLARSMPGMDAPTEVRQEYVDARQEWGRTMQDVLRSFEMHHRVELLEACLWFARELEAALWEQLNAPRSRYARVVSDHLESWDDPRLAGFLLQALSRSEFRTRALRMLATWNRPEHAAALLQHSDLLDAPEVCTNLKFVKRPAWFTNLGANMSRLPSGLRVQAPRWIAHLGFGVDEKLAYLTEWLRATDSEISLAALHALALMDAPAARSQLERLGTGSSPLAPFALWYSTGWEAGLVRCAPEDDGADADTTPDADVRHLFDTLWQRCRRSAPGENAELVGLIRENARAWQPYLAAQARSRDPRDRMLVLRIAGSSDLAGHFSGEVEELCRDDVEAVRRLAATLSKFASSAPAVDASSPATPTQLEPEQSAQRSAALRSRLHSLIEQIDAEESDAASLTDALQQLRDLLQECRTSQDESSPSAEETVS